MAAAVATQPVGRPPTRAPGATGCPVGVLVARGAARLAGIGRAITGAVIIDG